MNTKKSIKNLSLTAVTVLWTAAFAAGAFAQGADTAYVPFLVNVNATVTAVPTAGTASVVSQVQMTATGGVEAVLRIPLPKTSGVLVGAQKQASIPAVMSIRGGKIALSLSEQSYKNAEIALFRVSGKRVLRVKTSTSRAVSNISRSNIAPGIYLLSVSGADGAAFTSRITHGGGSLDISVAYASENISAATPQLTKATASAGVKIIVSAAEYADTSYEFQIVDGTSNMRQNITLRPAYIATVSGGTGGGSYAAGATVTIKAETAPAGQNFQTWTTVSSGVTFADANRATTTFTMPANAVTVTANFAVIPTYAVTVLSAGTGASGDRDYTAGARVTITAGTAPAGQQFQIWTTASSGVAFANSNYATTTFTMPANDVTVTAVFIVADGTRGTFIDSRDNTTYKTTTIGGKAWMAENLNYAASSGSWCYDNSPDSCVKYGRLYDWATAKTICPSGWHLPSYLEWVELAKAAGGTGNYGTGGTAGTRLKSSTGWNSSSETPIGTDNYRFSALPGGYRYSVGIYAGASSQGYWWTATEYDGSYAYRRYMGYNHDAMGEGNLVKSFGCSVRCISDN